MLSGHDSHFLSELVESYCEQIAIDLYYFDRLRYDFYSSIGALLLFVDKILTYQTECHLTVQMASHCLSVGFSSPQV